MADYRVLDVFTDTAFTGNPLAVVTGAEVLPEESFAQIAREFGFSETIFVMPPRAGGTHRVRIFTPTQEVPFAGHPLIGLSVALTDLGGPAQMLIETGAGLIPCLAEEGRAAFTRETELELLHRPQPAIVAACLDLPETAIRTEAHPPVVASAGLPFALVELYDHDALSRCRPRIDAFRRAQERYELPFDFAVYAYVREGDWVSARMFAPLDDTPEDPATGSAAAALGLLLREVDEADVVLTVRQGVEMGRPSIIGVMAEAGAVTISGAAVTVMEGRIALP